MKPLCKLCLTSLLAVCFFLLTGCGSGAKDLARDRLDKDGVHGFVTKKLKRGWWTRKYAVFVPKSYVPGTTRKYPVIIFLHGIGEGSGWGQGNLKNLTVGLAPEVAKRADSFDFFVIFPQSDGGWDPQSVYTQDMFTAWANTAREYPLDPDRVYLTGLSTGGHGTWDIAAAYPNRFAAIVPMASNGGDSANAEKLTQTPVRAFCSVFGDVFAWNNDQNMVKSIKTLNPKADAVFIRTPTLGHDCWDKAYAGYDLFDWLGQQRRSSTPVATVAKAAAPTPVPVTAPAPKPVVTAVAAAAPIAAPIPAPVIAIPVVTAVVSAPKAVAQSTPKPAPQATPKPTPRPAPAVASVQVSKPTAKPAAASSASGRAPTASPTIAKSATKGSAGEWVNTPW